MSNDPAYLFVYGTLRPGFTHSFALYLHQHSHYMGEGQCPGRLYDLGDYPGAVYQPDGSACVQGAVYDISNNPTILTRLDRYEGVSTPPSLTDEYVRAVVPVRVGERQLSCWMYLYNWPLVDKVEIASGDYSQNR